MTYQVTNTKTHEIHIFHNLSEFHQFHQAATLRGDKLILLTVGDYYESFCLEPYKEGE